MDSKVVEQADGVREDEIRIVMIGKTGCGKSATGNTIVNRPGHFESSLSGESITKKCKRGEAFRFGKKLLVVDTPGLFDTEMSNEDISKEIVKCIGISSPGPHAFILVVQLGRITKEEQETVKYFVKIFGPQMYSHLIVLFTRKDELNKDLDEFVGGIKGELKKIIQKCGQRCVAFNNKAPEDGDTERLVEMTENIVKANGGNYYIHGAYAEAEQSLIKRMKLFFQNEQRKKDKDITEIREKIKKNKDHMSNVEEKAYAARISLNQEDFDKQESKTEHGKENRKDVCKIVKRFSENPKMQTRKLDEQRGKEMQKINDEIQAGITKHQREDIAEQLEEMFIRQNSKSKDMEIEQEYLERQREEQFRKDTEAERLRDRARDECENENNVLLSRLINEMKKFVFS